MEAREQRALLKQKWAEQGHPCLSLSLNVPGYPKSSPTVASFFDHCLDELKYHLGAHQLAVKLEMAIKISDEAGDFFLVPVVSGKHPLEDWKQLCESFEENHPLGRFVDVDLNDQQGAPVSSGKSKLCFFCQMEPAIQCRRQKTHELEMVRCFMFDKMAEYNKKQAESAIVKRLSSLAMKALLYEISLTPKPGLVDKFSNGSHADMNYLTFLDSSAAISPYFGDLVWEGLSFGKEDDSMALPIIRSIGLRMEAAMYEATGKVNTHKGVIFLMGLSLFACGLLYKRYGHFGSEPFRSVVAGICKDLVQNELTVIPGRELTHGEEIFHKFGFSGARGEAESGFRTVFEQGLTQLAETSCLHDDALTRCFLSIASVNKDTNILFRSGSEVLSTFQHLCREILKNFNEANFSLLVSYCETENISPGGSADLLAISVFVWSVMKEEGKEFIATIIQKK